MTKRLNNKIEVKFSNDELGILRDFVDLQIMNLKQVKRMSKSSEIIKEYSLLDSVGKKLEVAS